MNAFLGGETRPASLSHFTRYESRGEGRGGAGPHHPEYAVVSEIRPLPFITHRRPDRNQQLGTLMIIFSPKLQDFSSGYLYLRKLTGIALNKKGYVSCLNLDLGWLFNNSGSALSKNVVF